MDRSRLSNIISVARVLPHFSTENLAVMKSCIFEQLECENEGEFLCKALQSLYKTLSIESLLIIKNKAIEIADSQGFQQSQQQKTSAKRGNDNNHITVYKHIQQQYSDPLSKLHSDIIDYLATFLNKKQSIEFGYLNKQLYIETQKQSYLTKRCNDKCLELTGDNLEKMIWRRNDGFDYSFPQNLTLSIGKSFNVSKIASFKNFFSRIKILKCCKLFSLSYVPVDILFNSTRNFYQDESSRHNIKLLRIEVDYCSEKASIGQANTFCKNLDDYKNECVKSDCNVMRNIEELELRVELYDAQYEPHADPKIQALKQLLLSCGSIAHSIFLCSSTNAIINNIQELKTIFHTNLIHFRLGWHASITMRETTRHNDQAPKDIKIGMLKRIGVEADDVQYANDAVFNTFELFDRFDMRRNVECYTVNWRQPFRIPFSHGEDDDISLVILNKIFFQDYDKHPLLRAIEIVFNDDGNLFRFAKLLYYFNQHYERLFVERRLYLKHFEKIEVNLQLKHLYAEQLIVPYHDDTSPHDHPTGNDEHSTIFDQTSNETYPIDKKIIEIEGVKQGIQSFGAIYQNVIVWLQAKQIHHRKQLYREAVQNCKIVFVFK